MARVSTRKLLNQWRTVLDRDVTPAVSKGIENTLTFIRVRSRTFTIENAMAVDAQVVTDICLRNEFTNRIITGVRQGITPFA